eukprot:Gregarina_sp_Poly_1__11324@NODE_948_length_5588_cov_118_430538_g672_i0_p2_GENE_NODE_948_length_5588_cov_118_430538_g672_i0NODE_948_length_5588_cov_118_430538_g672_i0_p2_ORF_typecomplete_len435_score63_97_NODE_948_length_5588_cov_118_430538_g672_i011332437
MSSLPPWTMLFQAALPLTENRILAWVPVYLAPQEETFLANPEPAPQEQYHAALHRPPHIAGDIQPSSQPTPQHQVVSHIPPLQKPPLSALSPSQISEDTYHSASPPPQQKQHQAGLHRSLLLTKNSHSRKYESLEDETPSAMKMRHRIKQTHGAIVDLRESNRIWSDPGSVFDDVRSCDSQMETGPKSGLLLETETAPRFGSLTEAEKAPGLETLPRFSRLMKPETAPRFDSCMETETAPRFGSQIETETAPKSASSVNALESIPRSFVSGTLNTLEAPPDISPSMRDADSKRHAKIGSAEDLISSSYFDDSEMSSQWVSRSKKAKSKVEDSVPSGWFSGSRKAKGASEVGQEWRNCLESSHSSSNGTTLPSAPAIASAAAVSRMSDYGHDIKFGYEDTSNKNGSKEQFLKAPQHTTRCTVLRGVSPTMRISET